MINTLGLEAPIQFSGAGIFDPTVANMLFEAQKGYVNAMHEDYLRGLNDIKEFKKEYNNFITPILADQEWYNNNVIGKVRNFINDAYANGIDLTRSAEGRAAISQLINSIDVGSVNKLRSSAENAREFLKERSRLEAQGLYNPLLAKYEGFDPNTYNTLDGLDAEGNIIAGRGIWDKMSPTRITDMATFGNPYFEGMKPNVHAASKNGISYSIEKIDENDLRAIADAHYNELVSTPQGQLMHRYYTDLAGGDPIKARQMFNDAVVDGQRRRIYQKDDYDDNYFKVQNLKLQQASHQLARDKFNWDKAMDLLQLGVDENGNPLPSANGYGANNKILGAGAADQLAVTQDKHRAEYINQIKAEIDAVDKRANSAYSKMSPGFKVIADKYKKYVAILSDKTSSKDKIKEAADFITRWQDNGNKEFQNWKQQYDNSLRDKHLQYYNYLTGENKFGEEQDQRTTLSNAHDIFQKANVVPNLTTKQKQDLNTALNLVESDNGLTGTVTNDTEYSPVTEARFTGNRMYRHNSFISKINRLIQGKDYTVSDKDVSGRNYASAASRDKVRYDIIQQMATFKGDDLKELLGNISDESLKEYGIERISDDEYKIPISTRFSKGNQSWADVNTATHIRNKSVNEEAAIEQARSLVRKYGK